jgi:hypothetical protein
MEEMIIVITPYYVQFDQQNPDHFCCMSNLFHDQSLSCPGRLALRLESPTIVPQTER